MTGYKIALRGAAAAGLALAVLALPATPEAKELNYSLGLGPGSAVAIAADVYAEKVAELSEGDLSIRVFPLSLVSLPEMGPGIRDGLTDIGYMAAPYYPAEFATANFLAEQSMALNLRGSPENSDLAYAGAMTEYILTKCPECLEEFKAQNHVYMGHIASSKYYLLCNTEVATLDALQGKRLRAGGASFQRFAEHFGAVGVQMPANEAYEGLSQGVLDCAMLSAPELTNFRLMEVVDAITLGVPGNVFGGTVAGNINRDTWQGLSEAERKVLIKAGAMLAAHITWNYHAADAENLAEAREQGKSVLQPADDLVEAVKAFVQEDQAVVADLYQTNFDVSRADEMQEEFSTVLDKWLELTKDVDSAEALTSLYYGEIYAKLDPSTYGMN